MSKSLEGQENRSQLSHQESRFKKARRWIKGQIPDWLQLSKKKQFPSSIDVNPTAQCNLACSFCWGPDHAIENALSTQEWKKTLKFFKKNGTTNVVFTGGEPLLRNDIGELTRYAKELGMRVTLSTNTLLLRKKAKEVLPYVDEVGIPLDGSTHENNRKMRKGINGGNPQHFTAVMRAVGDIKREYPGIEVTVRTVVSKVNKTDIEAIGAVLAAHQGTFDRWKIYQFAPVSYGEKNEAEHAISLEEFMTVAKGVEERFQNELPIRVYYAEERPGRYVFVGPEGNIFGVGEDGKYQQAGNILTARRRVVKNNIRLLIDPERNQLHAQKNEKTIPSNSSQTDRRTFWGRARGEL